jgi:hypothetical protein
MLLRRCWCRGKVAVRLLLIPLTVSLIIYGIRALIRRS